MANGEPDNRFLRRDWSAGRSSARMFKVSELAKVNREACCCEVVTNKTKERSPSGKISGVCLECDVCK